MVAPKRKRDATSVVVAPAAIEMPMWEIASLARSVLDALVDST